MIPPNIAEVAKTIVQIVDDHKGLVWDDAGEMRKAVERKVRRYLGSHNLGATGLDVWYDRGIVRVRVEDYYWLSQCN